MKSENKGCDTKSCHMGGVYGKKSFCDTCVTWDGRGKKVLKKWPVTRDTIYERALTRRQATRFYYELSTLFTKSNLVACFRAMTVFGSS